ncbi:MAG: hypothetical protein IJJ69_07480 [Oscillospiraceae bacterium]|nr:hypothetical protein [Oscillospiraceae bacterium]
MQEELQNHKIKIVCRLTEELQYRQEIFLDNQLCTSHPDAVRAAELFLNAFDPEAELRNAEEELDSTSIVLVFRTSEAQMLEFCQIPEIHDMIQKSVYPQ